MIKAAVDLIAVASSEQITYRFDWSPLGNHADLRKHLFTSPKRIREGSFAYLPAQIATILDRFSHSVRRFWSSCAWSELIFLGFLLASRASMRSADCLWFLTSYTFPTSLIFVSSNWHFFLTKFFLWQSNTLHISLFPQIDIWWYEFLNRYPKNYQQNVRYFFSSSKSQCTARQHTSSDSRKKGSNSLFSIDFTIQRK